MKEPKSPSNKRREERIEQLRNKFKEIDLELKFSPCFYKGCDLWSDCRGCDGFMKGCTARLPEVLFKNKNGTWKKDVY